MSDTRELVKQFIMERVLAEAEARDIGADTPLNEGGLLDSLATSKLVVFLEDRFQIEIQPDDLFDGRLSSLASIERLVEERRGG